MRRGGNATWNHRKRNRTSLYMRRWASRFCKGCLARKEDRLVICSVWRGNHKPSRDKGRILAALLVVHSEQLKEVDLGEFCIPWSFAPWSRIASIMTNAVLVNRVSLWGDAHGKLSNGWIWLLSQLWRFTSPRRNDFQQASSHRCICADGQRARELRTANRMLRPRLASIDIGHFRELITLTASM
jgi:hypothetical protein